MKTQLKSESDDFMFSHWATAINRPRREAISSFEGMIQDVMTRLWCEALLSSF